MKVTNELIHREIHRIRRARLRLYCLFPRCVQHRNHTPELLISNAVPFALFPYLSKSNFCDQFVKWNVHLVNDVPISSVNDKLHTPLFHMLTILIGSYLVFCLRMLSVALRVLMYLGFVFFEINTHQCRNLKHQFVKILETLVVKNIFSDNLLQLVVLHNMLFEVYLSLTRFIWRNYLLQFSC